MSPDLDSIVNDFKKVYARFHVDREPYLWQQRLLREVITEGRWPDTISAPTGSGKTCVIDIHVFLNALAGEAIDSSSYSPGLRTLLEGLPRRLALLVPRRALVDDQTTTSEDIQMLIEDNRENDPLLDRLWHGLQARAGADLLTGVQDKVSPPALLVDSVRGGRPRKKFLDSDAWQTHPTYCAVIHMTPDMFGSALLFRHYGAGPKRRPQDAGLLAIDTVAILDEGHLQRQLLLTSRRVRELDSEGKGSGRPGVQVVATTATPGGDGASELVVSVSEDDLEDTSLRRRLQTTKKVDLVCFDHDPASLRGIQEIVALLLDLEGRYGKPVGFFANTVKQALAVSAALKELSDQNLKEEGVFTVVGRMRPIDRILSLTKDYPGVLSPSGNERVRFIVGTQALEVGVDLSMTAMITELASPSALAQRSGRVARFGSEQDSQVLVIVPPKPKPGPYTEDELAEGQQWVADLDGNINAWSVHQHPASAPHLGRGLLQRLERWDADYLSNTSETLAAEKLGNAGIELWTTDSFDEGVDINIVMRSLPPNDVAACRLIELVPPERLEYLPTNISIARDVLKSLLDKTKNPASFRRFFRWDPVTHTATAVRGATEGTEDSRIELSPRETVIVDSISPIFHQGVALADGTERLEDRKQEAIAQATDHELDALSGLVYLAEDSDSDTGTPWQESGFLRLNKTEAKGLFQAWDTYCASTQSSEDEAELQQEIRQILVPSENSELDKHDFDIVVDEETSPRYAVITRKAPKWDGSESFYETSSRRKRVTLANHNTAVEDRAVTIAGILGLPTELSKALALAGLHHDDGKKDVRFQILLRNGRKPKSDAPPLAKSGSGSYGNQKRLRTALGLTGFRHEQLSVAIADTEVPGDCAERSLVLRLIGTTHGYGRALFNQGTASLISDFSGVYPEVHRSAVRLFDEGLWEALVEQTNLDYGYWTCAYLEALLRAADVTVSAEGR